MRLWPAVFILKDGCGHTASRESKQEEISITLLFLLLSVCMFHFSCAIHSVYIWYLRRWLSVKELQFLNHDNQMLPAANVQGPFKQSNIWRRKHKRFCSIEFINAYTTLLPSWSDCWGMMHIYILNLFFHLNFEVCVTKSQLSVFWKKSFFVLSKRYQNDS